MKTDKKFFVMITIVTFLAFPNFLLAQSQGGGNPPTSQQITIPNPIKEDTVMGFITALLNNVVMPIATVAVVMWIIWAGFQYVLAQGNPTKIQKAHQQLLWSLIGAGILLGAAAIAEVVKNTIEALK